MMLITPKLIEKISSGTIKLPSICFIDIDILNFMWKDTGMEIAKRILKNSRGEGTACLISRLI